MKQIIQHLNNGITELVEVPSPTVRPGHVLIKATRSLVSLGTERMLVEFGKGSILVKAKAQPDKVKQVLEKIQADGVLPTLEAVFNKLGQPLPMGYCNVGRVIAVGEGVTEFVVGDRVASNGPHAEVVCVPRNLCAKIPDSVDDDSAAFTVVGSIGLQGIRLLQPTFGETVVVVGLGLIGLIAGQILKANGCRVIGFDFDQKKVDLANAFGMIAVNPTNGTNQVKYVLGQTGEIGADAVLITASAKDSDIISQSAQMCRKRGRIVLVGVIGLDISRADFYEKELSFQVSCSYGPGRYDEQYEEKGIDYPIGFVRWTEKRNFEAILGALASKQINVQPMITNRVPLKEYNRIYGNINSSSSIASLLLYDETADTSHIVNVNPRNNGKLNFGSPLESAKNSKSVDKGSGLAIIGAGNFTNATVLPALKPLNVDLKYIVSAGGLTARTLAKKAGSSCAATDYKDVLADKAVGMVIITTRHNQHARMVIDSIQAGKHVFVEKPLCLNEIELSEIVKVYQALVSESKTLTITVGFNRRFAPLAQKMKRLLGEGPCNIVATMNAGEIPNNVWVQDLTIGGGRIIGEGCHFIDLCSFLTDSMVTSVCMNALGIEPKENTDNASLLLRYDNGSNAVINYWANGNKGYAKERVEVHSQGRTLVLDNWRSLQGFGFKNFSKVKRKQDKGHSEQFRRLMEGFKNNDESIIPFESIVNTTRATFAAIESLKENRWVKV